MVSGLHGADAVGVPPGRPTLDGARRDPENAVMTCIGRRVGVLVTGLLTVLPVLPDLLREASPAVAAQSLGEIARQEEARRQAIRASGKVYTNDSLPKDAAGAPIVAAPATSSSVPAAASPTTVTPGQEAAPPATPGDPTTQAAPSQAAPKNEAYWRNRITVERDALTRAEIFAEALQSRINALAADFTARDDPFQRERIGLDHTKAIAELDRVKQEIQRHTKTVADIQEEARRAGAPAGWTR